MHWLRQVGDKGPFGAVTGERGREGGTEGGTSRFRRVLCSCLCVSAVCTASALLGACGHPVAARTYDRDPVVERTTIVSCMPSFGMSERGFICLKDPPEVDRAGTARLKRSLKSHRHGLS